MTNNNIERMKKMIEEKKKASSQQGSNEERPNRKIGKQQKAFKSTKRGGVTDK